MRTKRTSLQASYRAASVWFSATRRYKTSVSNIIAAIMFVAALCGAGGPALAEVSEVRLARQYGIAHLQLIIMEDLRLVEKHAKGLGLGDLKVTWQQFSNGPAMNEALISRNLDFASGGLTSLIVLWDKSKGAYVGLSPLSSMPAVMITRNPAIKSIRDFTANDRIALPAVGVSMQAIILQMYAEREFGKGEQTKLDSLTVSLPHPDAMATLLAGGSEITSHFTAAPYYYQEEQNPTLHRVLNSNDLLGGPATYSVVWASKKFMADNPKVTRAVLEAAEEATQLIKDNPRGMGELYIKAESPKLDPALAEKILRDPDNVFTTTPQHVMTYVDFMTRTGRVRNKAASWKDLFSPPIHDKPGS
jgi:NitT/TauT family transport system substrate-binding protein